MSFATDIDETSKLNPPPTTCYTPNIVKVEWVCSTCDAHNKHEVRLLLVWNCVPKAWENPFEWAWEIDSSGPHNRHNPWYRATTATCSSLQVDNREPARMAAISAPIATAKAAFETAALLPLGATEVQLSLECGGVVERHIKYRWRQAVGHDALRPYMVLSTKGNKLGLEGKQGCGSQLDGVGLNGHRTHVPPRIRPILAKVKRDWRHACTIRKERNISNWKRWRRRWQFVFGIQLIGDSEMVAFLPWPEHFLLLGLLSNDAAVPFNHRDIFRRKRAPVGSFRGFGGFEWWLAKIKAHDIMIDKHHVREKFHATGTGVFVVLPSESRPVVQRRCEFIVATSKAWNDASILG